MRPPPRDSRLPEGALIGWIAHPSLEGHNGKYAVAYIKGVDGSIVISHAVFEDGVIPSEGDTILMEDVRDKHNAGWYARKARIVRPELDRRIE